MHILFLTLVEFKRPIGKGIYPDLLKALVQDGHRVTVICPDERRNDTWSEGFEENGIRVIPVKSLNLQKTNSLEKGLATISIQRLFIRKIKEQCKQDSFDIVLYSTPPITFAPVVSFVKKRYGAIAYLLLKDIFPQNAVDLGILRKRGLLHRWFSRVEAGLYKISDYIGCMSPGNYEYILQRHPHLKSKLEINPNSLDVLDLPTAQEDLVLQDAIKVPNGAKLIVYGGNLGKPQAISQLLESVQLSCERNNVFFAIAGSGTEAKLVDSFFKDNPTYGVYFEWLEPQRFEQIVRQADLCLVHLSHKFTIPNFPSRILAYMASRKPIFAAVDTSTDLPKLLKEEGFGVSCLSADSHAFERIVGKACANEYKLEEMGQKGYDYLLNHYDVRSSAQLIVEKFELNRKELTS